MLSNGLQVAQYMQSNIHPPKGENAQCRKEDETWKEFSYKFLQTIQSHKDVNKAYYEDVIYKLHIYIYIDIYMSGRRKEPIDQAVCTFLRWFFFHLSLNLAVQIAPFTD